MEDTFLNAFNEATAQEKAAQKAQGATANINQQSYEQCINILQKYANGQVTEWDPNDLDTLLKLLNDAGFSDKALQKINPILNNAKKQIQAQQKKPEDAKAENPQGYNGEDAPTTEQPKQPEQKGADTTTDSGNASTTGKGDPSKVTNNPVGQNLANSINRFIGGENPQANVDDLIAYLQTLKK